MRVFKSLLLGVTALGGVSVFAPAAAQAAAEEAVVLDDVIVTAQRRDQRVIDVPIAITALTGQTLEEQGVRGLQDLAGKIPGTQFLTESDGSVRVTIRGISSLSGSSSTVGVYLDDTPIASRFFQPGLTSFDVERIEVLRGPQGTLYGEASTSGTLRILTNKPDPREFGAKVEGTVSSTEGAGDLSYGLNGMLNIPVIQDKLAVRIVGNWEDNAGWVDAPNLGRDDVNGVTRNGGRVSVRATPTEDLTLTVMAMRQTSEVGGHSESDSDLVTQHLFATPWTIQDDYSLYSGTIEYRLPFANFTSATGWFDRDQVSRDDLSSPDLMDLMAFVFDVVPEGVGVQFRSLQKTFVQEFRLVSTDDGPLHWTVGAFYKNSDNRGLEDGIVNVGGVGYMELASPLLGLPPLPGVKNRARTETKEYAAYGDFQYDFTEALSGIVGVRYSRHDMTSHQTTEGVFNLFTLGQYDAVNDTEDKQEVVTPKFSLSYKVNPDLHLYATAARGFRVGGTNTLGGLLPDAVPVYGPDSAWSYELGGKAAFLDRRLEVEGAVYHIDWTDVQVLAKSAFTDGFYIMNGGEADSDGAEIHVVARPAEGWRLEAGATYTKAEITASQSAGVPVGATLPYVPRVGWDASVQYRHSFGDDLVGTARLGVVHVGSRFGEISNSPLYRAASYDLVDARLSLEKGPFEAMLFVQNLFDERGEMAADNTYPGQFRYVQPRTIGLTLRARY